MHHALIVEDDDLAVLSRAFDDAERQLLGIPDYLALDVDEGNPVFSDCQYVLVIENVQSHEVPNIVELQDLYGFKVFSYADHMPRTADGIDATGGQVDIYVTEVISVIVEDGIRIQFVTLSLTDYDLAIVAYTDEFVV